MARTGTTGPVTFPVAGPVMLPALAIDDKAVRGAIGPDGMIPYLLAAATHGDAAVVIAERLIGPKTNEVPEFQPLLRELDLAGWVLTMDAGHTVRSHATFISGELLAHFISDRRKACSSGWMPWTGHRSRHAQERRDRARAQGDQDHPGHGRAR
jgi:hypothetical protein